MYYLVYYSSASCHYDDLVLKSILTKSRENNVLQNITGLLLYHDGNIIQVLEGEKDNVLGTYKKILRDLRHKNPIKVIEGETENRNFPDWSMGFKSVSSDEIRTLTGYSSLSKSTFLNSLDGNVSKDKKIITLLRKFVQTNL